MFSDGKGKNLQLPQFARMFKQKFCINQTCGQ